MISRRETEKAWNAISLFEYKGQELVLDTQMWG